MMVTILVDVLGLDMFSSSNKYLVWHRISVRYIVPDELWYYHIRLSYWLGVRNLVLESIVGVGFCFTALDLLAII